MKRIFTTSLIILFYSLIAAQTPNWFPLSVGNRWQYLDYTYDKASHAGTLEGINLRSVHIDRDTLIDSTKYYFYDDQWVRYTDNKIYIWNNGAEYLYMDFNLPIGTLFISYYKGKADSVVITFGTYNLLGRNYTYKGFEPYGQNGKTTKFVSNFGRAYFYKYYYYRDIFYETTDEQEYTFILSLIKDSTGSFICTKGNIKPTFITNPILYTVSSAFSWVADVTHSYSHNYNYSSLNFVDSVYFKSFYSYRDSLFTNSTTVVVPPGPSNYYLPTAVLDTNLLKTGWVYKYKLMATDKCFVPDTGTTPDTGYYSCVWAGPTSVIDKNILPTNFSLYQNYPNPFNPTTVIKYQIPLESNISIKVYNSLGENVREYNQGIKQQGIYYLTINFTGLPSGIYFYSLKAISTDGKNNFNSVKKMILMK
jgi:hypothetical protein